MILPTKRIGDRALISLGAQALGLLDKPKTVSALWRETKQLPVYADRQAALTYDWFVLALDLLFALGAIDLANGEVSRTRS
jgi:ABC-three component (ABC-3C) system Middle Component 6